MALIKIKLFMLLTEHLAMKAYWSGGTAPSALDGDEWSASHPGSFIHRDRAPGTHKIGGWLGPRVSVDMVVRRKIPSPWLGPEPPIIQIVAQLSWLNNNNKFVLSSVKMCL
jgi:hypothetical protein